MFIFGDMSPATINEPLTKSAVNGTHGTPKLPLWPKVSKAQGDSLTLPPGITSEQFHEFIAAAKGIVGDENVTIISESSQLSHEHYIDPSKAHDMHNIVDREYFVASAVLCPREVPDVQEILRLCNKTEVPVWPFSIGRK